jgi:ketosteroid isomerase-like protein
MLDGGVADSGDLAYAYGELTWTEAGTPRRGYYNRIWRRDAAGRWRVLFDQMNVRPES